MATPDLTNHHERIAKETWRLMRRMALSKGMSKTRDARLGDGRILPASIASFVWAASSSIGGDEITANDVDAIRAYLKATGNVVSKGQIAGAKFRSFVREEWNPTSTITNTAPHPEPDAIDKRAERLRPEEVGEDRPPAPVEIRKTNGASGEDYVWARHRLAVLAHLDHVDRVVDEKGFASTRIREALPGVDWPRAKEPTDTLSDFVERGYVGRQMKNPRRTLAYWITDKGKEVLGKAMERGHWDDSDYTTARGDNVIVRHPAKVAEVVPDKPGRDDEIVPMIDGAGAPSLMQVARQVMKIVEYTAESMRPPADTRVTKIEAIIHRDDLSPIAMLHEIEEVIRDHEV